jgi:hypothetical protein
VPFPLVWNGTESVPCRFRPLSVAGTPLSIGKTPFILRVGVQCLQRRTRALAAKRPGKYRPLPARLAGEERLMATARTAFITRRPLPARLAGEGD